MEDLRYVNIVCCDIFSLVGLHTPTQLYTHLVLIKALGTTFSDILMKVQIYMSAILFRTTRPINQLQYTKQARYFFNVILFGLVMRRKVHGSDTFNIFEPPLMRYVLSPCWVGSQYDKILCSVVHDKNADRGK